MKIKRDFMKSAYTGLTYDSWIEAGERLLEGAFQNIKSDSDPVLVERREFKVTYPHNKEGVLSDWERSAERFEGLTRTLFIAAPLMASGRTNICGIDIKKYYRRQIISAVTEGDPLYVGSYEYWQEAFGNSDPNHCYQQTVETCALVIGLWASKEYIWDTYAREEKDRIAAFISSYAHAHTCTGNWRLFNMLMLAFLHREGYGIDEELMMDHAQNIAAYYAGDGWYRDGHSFDYYSIWGFQFYAPIWNLWYGYENMPGLARIFEERSNRLMQNYANFFDEEGHMNLWGRSCIYRFASVSAFAGNFFLKHSKAEPGLARRIASGCLLQFIDRDDFLERGVPSLGFYGDFLPCVQGYSCAESVYWLGKAFILLLLGRDHPFWTSPEKGGIWDELKPSAVKETVLCGPALVCSNHKANGTTLLRTGKVVRKQGDETGNLLYGRLVFSTKYPPEAAPAEGVEAQQYVLHDLSAGGIYRHANAILWHGEKGGVLYRRAFFDYSTSQSWHWTQAINLADFPVPYGIFRADKLRLYRRPVEISLGSYGFADNGTLIQRKEKAGAKAVILKGRDATGREKQLAMTVFAGWDSLEIVRSKGTNADSENSIVIVARTARMKEYGYEPYLLCSQTLTKESHEDFTEDELFPLTKIEAEDVRGYSAYGKTVLSFVNGDRVEVDFDGIEGNLQL